MPNVVSIQEDSHIKGSTLQEHECVCNESNNQSGYFVIKYNKTAKVSRRNRPRDMATFKDPTRCFAPLEVVERLIEIRQELGYSKNIYLENVNELTDSLDAYGFDIYAFSTRNEKINYGDYRTPVVPGGDTMHTSLKAH